MSHREHKPSRTRRPAKRASGFTLIELTIVVAVIAILAAILVPTILGVVERSRERTARATLVNLQKTYARYFQDTGSWPHEGGSWLFQSDGNTAGVFDNTFTSFRIAPTDDPLLPECPPGSADTRCWNGPYLLHELEEVRDPWGNHYRYYMLAPSSAFAASLGLNCPGCSNLADEEAAGGIIIYSMGRNGVDDTTCTPPAGDGCAIEPDNFMKGKPSSEDGDDIIVIVTNSAI